MSKIKVLFYAGSIDFGGTWRSHEQIFASLNRDLFDPYIFYWNDCPYSNRLPYVKDLFEEKRLIPFQRSEKRKGRFWNYSPYKTNFHTLAKSFNFDIIHIGRSGYAEWPFTHRMAPIQVETNIFGHRDKTRYLDKSIAISNTVSDMRGGTERVIYNPIPKAELAAGNLRKGLNIPTDAIVCGRIGRPANFDPIALKAFSRLSKKFPSLYYIIIAPCSEAKAMANTMDRVILLDPTNDDSLINQFFNTLDLFLHYRSDGETHGMAIAQAMIYGVPVVSHFSPHFNAQTETIGSGGFVAKNVDEYYNYAKTLIQNSEERKARGLTAQKIANQNYSIDVVSNQIQNSYLQWQQHLKPGS